MRLIDWIWYLPAVISGLSVIVFLPWMIIAIVAAIFGVDIWMPLL